jgi:hypothetical protein
MVVGVWENVSEAFDRFHLRYHLIVISTTQATTNSPTRPYMSPKVLIVCLGNICRSQMGEAVLRHIAKQRNIDLIVDSAGTAAYHVGEEPDDRSVL